MIHVGHEIINEYLAINNVYLEETEGYFVKNCLKMFKLNLSILYDFY